MITVTVTVTRVYGDDFATPAELEDMTDQEVIDRLKELSLGDFLDGAGWVIER